MRKENVNKVYLNHLCAGCGTCSLACSHDAISFRRDSIGQIQPLIDNSKCVGCGLCMDVCPGVDLNGVFSPVASCNAIDSIVGQCEGVYVGKSLNEDIYRNSQSGGVATALLSHLFFSRLIDAALVARQTDTLPSFAVVTSPEQLSETQKSQYVTVNLLSGLKQMTSFTSVAVVGLPCHIEGVHLLQKANSLYARNVKYRVGLICGGSFPSAMSEVVLSMAGCDERKGTTLVWRSKKSAGYKNADIEILSGQSGKSRFLSRRIRHNGKKLLTPPRCRLCFDKLNLYADIVVGDSWGMSGIDKVSGNSVIVVRNSIGASLLSDAVPNNCIEINKADLGELVKGQKVSDKLSYTIACLDIFIQKGWLTPGWSGYFEKQTADMNLPNLQSEVLRFVALSRKENAIIHAIVERKIRHLLQKERIKNLIRKIISYYGSSD